MARWPTGSPLHGAVHTPLPAKSRNIEERGRGICSPHQLMLDFFARFELLTPSTIATAPIIWP